MSLRACTFSLAVCLIVAGFLGFLFAFVVKPDFWPELSKPEQCECLARDWGHGTAPTYDAAAQARVIREPQNTWSNLAYLFVAVWMVQRFRDPAIRWMAIAVALLGLGSLLYHASGSRTLRHLDIMGMYWVFSLVVLLALRVWFRETRGRDFAPRGWWALALGTLIVAVLATAYRNLRIFDFKPLHISVATGATAVVAATLIAGICLHRRDARSWRLFATMLVLLGAGLVLQIGDRPGGWLCVPGALVQPHAVWHICSAACLAVAMPLLDDTRNVASETRA